MKKSLIILLSIFAIDATLFCSENTRNFPVEQKKSNIIMRIVKPLAVAIPIIISGREYAHYLTKPCDMDQHPIAKNWFDRMGEKYPVTDLNNAEFCVDQTWLSSGNRIFFPAQGLNQISQIHNKTMSNQTLDENDKFILNQHEFLLLHEAGHRKNNDMGIINMGYELTKNQMVRATMSMGTVPLIAETMAYLYNEDNKIQVSLERETRADKFACDHAKDTEVLQGGLNFFNHLKVNNLNDPLHPNSQERAQKVIDEMKRRWIIDNTCPAQK